MMQNIKHKVNGIMKYLLLVLFLGYYGSATLFYHTHHIENGGVIVHSHIYKNGTEKNPNHSHTAKEFVYFQLLSEFVSTVTFLGFSFEIFKVVVRSINTLKNDDNYYNHTYLKFNGLRAPPSSFAI